MAQFSNLEVNDASFEVKDSYSREHLHNAENDISAIDMCVESLEAAINSLSASNVAYDDTTVKSALDNLISNTSINELSDYILSDLYNISNINLNVRSIGKIILLELRFNITANISNTETVFKIPDKYRPVIATSLQGKSVNGNVINIRFNTDGTCRAWGTIPQADYYTANIIYFMQ